jgi:hypothetical protein
MYVFTNYFLTIEYDNQSDKTATTASVFGSTIDFQSSQAQLCSNPSQMIDKMTQFSPSDLESNWYKIKEPVQEKEYTGMKRYWGLILAVASSLLLSLVNLFAKILQNYGFDAYGVSLWR